MSLHFLRRYLAGALPQADTLASIFPEIGIECEDLVPLSQILKDWKVAEIRKMRLEDEGMSIELWDGNSLIPAFTTDTTLELGLYVPVRKEERGYALGSEWDLGIGGSTLRIMRLSSGFPPGTPLSQIYPEDFFFYLTITPNRGDLLSYVGIARDLAVRLRMKLRLPRRLRAAEILLEQGEEMPALVARFFPWNPKPAFFSQELKMTDPDALRYGLAEIRWTKPVTGDSPQEIRMFLGRSGIRSVHPLVDLTNCVLLEIGQPLHAFDASAVQLPLEVRSARPGESLHFLDGFQREFQGGELLITDARGPLALAGVMGGKESGIQPTTHVVFLESAWFSPPRVMRSRRRLGVSTESSYRFERGTDPLGVELGILRFLDLCTFTPELRRFIVNRVEIRGAKVEKRTVLWNRDVAETIAGVLPPEPQVTRILKELGFSLLKGRGRGKLWGIPRFRHDIKILPDLVEEILRLNGYDSVPLSLPHFSPTPLIPRSEKSSLREESSLIFRQHLCDWLVEQGFVQGIHMSIGENRLFSTTPVPKLANPLAVEERWLRWSLFPGIFKAMMLNEHNGERTLKLFEIGSVFTVTSLSVAERLHLGILLRGTTGSGSPGARSVDFLDLKGIVERLLRYLRIPSWEFDTLPSSSPWTEIFATGEAFQLCRGGVFLGVIGRVSRKRVLQHDFKDPPFYAELCVDELEQAVKKLSPPRFLPLRRFPFVERDFSFLFSDLKPAGQLLKILRERLAPAIAPVVLERLELFDYYRSKNLQGQVAIGIRIRIRHPDRTLTQEDIEAISSMVLEVAEKQGATLRLNPVS